MAAPATAVQRASAPSDFNPLLKKCGSEDADIRYMVLADMASMLLNSPPTILSSENKYSLELIDKVTELVDDSNGDVQSQALKTVGPLANKLSPEQLMTFIRRLVTQKTKRSLDQSVYTTAARTVVTSLPHPSAAGIAAQATAVAYAAVERIIVPRLIGQAFRDAAGNIAYSDRGLLELSDDGTADIEGIELAAQVVLCYGVMLSELEKKNIMTRLIALLDDGRPSVVAQKKAVIAVSSLSRYLTEVGFKTELIPSIASRLSRSNIPPRQRRMLTTLIGSLAEIAPRRLKVAVDKLVPLVLRPVSGDEFNELTAAAQEDGADVQREEIVEAALTTLEELFTFCGQALSPHADQAINASLKFLTYDPNLVQQDDDDDDMADDDDFAADDEDDFEDDADLSDSDDSSWKIRRCAAKVLHAIIKAGASASLLESGVLYDKIAPVLIKRFSEREESVRLEIVAAVALLIQKTADAGTLSFQTNTKRNTAGQTIVSRKRRRSSTVQSTGPRQLLVNSGEVSPSTSPLPTSGPQSDLAKIASKIAAAAVAVFKQKSVPSKQAVASLLKDLILAQHGKLDQQLAQILPATIELAKTTNTSLGGSSASSGHSGTATGTTLRIVCLQLLAAACDNHSSKALESHITDITLAAVTSVQDSHFKISAEAILTCTSVIQALTPPRTLGAQGKSQGNLTRIFEALSGRAGSQAAELEVRHNAIRALGVLIARTVGQPELLSINQRRQALQVLIERLNNEVTRLATIDALDTIADSPITASDYPAEWLRTISLELANQIRKSDRTLSSNSLSTLNNILSQDNVGDILGDRSKLALIDLLLPSTSLSGAGQLTVALLSISQLVRSTDLSTISAKFYQDVSQLANTQLAGTLFHAYLDLVDTIASNGAGKALLGLLMQIGIAGPVDVVGAAIGTLLAVSKDDLGITYQDIGKELATSQDDKRKALALSVLGQYGQCLGPSSPLAPRDFLPYLDGTAEVSRSAALALGRAGSTKTDVFFPVILTELKRAKDIKRQSVLLPAVKEILVKSSPRRSNVSAQAEELWPILLDVAASEDNRAIGAECVGKLAIVDPAKFVPQLQAQASAPKADVRALMIQAFRFALADSGIEFEEHIRPVIAPLLTAMLRDSDIENRRLALMTLNAAFSAKPNVVAPHLQQLLAIVVERSRIDPRLVREVQMGPFKHKVDDGLDIRKSAYETLHSLVDSVYSLIDPGAIVERIIDGLGDDHDIKILCALIVSKLVVVDRQQVGSHLHEIAARFSLTVNFKLKDTAVKQEIERAAEATRDILKATLIINNAFGSGAEVDQTIWISWKAYIDMLNKDYKAQLLQAEVLNETR